MFLAFAIFAPSLLLGAHLISCTYYCVSVALQTNNIEKIYIIYITNRKSRENQAFSLCPNCQTTHISVSTIISW